MRDWNLFYFQITTRILFVESLPMRDWNLNNWQIHFSLSASWEPTYEGLKLVINLSNLAFGEGWEPTYEGLKSLKAILKSSEAFTLRAYLWGIETMGSHELSRTFLWLRAYLWGIETFCLLFWYDTRYSLRAYLWGIETYKIFPIPARADVRWEPTYEGLKPEWDFRIDCGFRCWEPTYEGLKHFTLTVQSVEESQLRAYLWGIETHIYLTKT